MQKERYRELQAELLQIEEEMAKARVKIYEGEKIDQKVSLKTLTVADMKAGDSKYPVITKKQKYLDQDEKSSAATQFQATPRVNSFSTTNNQQRSYRIINIICKTNRVVLQQIKMKSQTGSQNLVRIMRLVPCCTNWSKSNQHLV